MKILVMNGPNLNLLGTREPGIYGSFTLEDLKIRLENTFPQAGFLFFQSNMEGEIINELQQTKADAIILNAGGYTHTSVSIADALKAVNIPYIEVHISNVYNRETFRHTSLLAAGAKGVIAGLGIESYVLAAQYFLNAHH